MIVQGPPAWFERGREFAARLKSPFGPFAAKKADKVASLYLYDMIGKDPWGGGGIDPQDVVKEIAAAKDAEQLDVHVNSPGGFVFDGIAIYNAIRAFDGDRTVYVDGLAASIASVISLAGDRVVTSEGGMWMIHEAMGGLFVWGTADEIEEAARKESAALRKIRENILDIYSTQTGQSHAKLSAWMAAETWMTAAEAKERGFTDEIAAVAEPDDGEAAAVVPLRPAALHSPGVVADLARARVAQLNERFPRASPGPAPGQPGLPNQTPGNRQKAKSP